MNTYIISTAGALFFCVIDDNDFVTDPHNLIYPRILLMMIFLYVPVMWPCMLVASVLKHILGGHQKLSNAEKKLKKLSSENRHWPCLFSKFLLFSVNKPGQNKNMR